MRSETLRQCNPDDPAFEGDEPYKVSPSSFYEVDEEKEARIDAIALATMKVDFSGVVKRKTED